jgi:hypothetical protein
MAMTEYIAQVRTRRGKLTYTSGKHATREAAVAEAFKAVPWAHKCSTGYGVTGGFDIRWHERDGNAAQWPLPLLETEDHR